MKISIVRSGGFGGLTLKAEFDLATMPKEKADRFNSRLSRVLPLDQFDLNGSPSADGFQYSLNVSDDNGSHSVQFYERGNPQLNELATFLFDEKASEK